MGRPHKGPECGAYRSVAKGYRHTKTMGKRCIRLCKACGKKFTPRNQKPRVMPERSQPDGSETQEPRGTRREHEPHHGQEPAEEQDPMGECDAESKVGESGPESDDREGAGHGASDDAERREGAGDGASNRPDHGSDDAADKEEKDNAEGGGDREDSEPAQEHSSTSGSRWTS